ncbi:MAG: hypothetical protein N3C63_02710 [Rhodocyclaceae bacterium]|nr:hypothetical protein [Rhodocyclaceae bacterium]
MASESSRCPLCGARLDALRVLDACEEMVGEGVLGCRCPFCQGYFEVRPTTGKLEIGYLRGGQFETVLTLPCEGLAVLRDTTNGALRLRLAGRDWKFDED